jgi:hypothetical protein
MDRPSREHATDASGAPQPVRGSAGTDDPSPRNVDRDRQNPDMLTPPETDSGTIPNARARGAASLTETLRFLNRGFTKVGRE